MFAIQYFRIKWKRNKLSIVVSYDNLNIKKLKLISKIVLHLKQKNKISWRVLNEHPWD